MMAQTRTFLYHDGGSFQLLELPYARDELAMVVILPKEVEGLPALEAKLTEKNLTGWLRGASRTRVEVEFPRFSLTEGLQLADTLADMGMSSAFDRSRADFSGMNGKRDLSISKVIHKAFVDVNEKGTEAAAATAVTAVRAMAALPAKPVRFRADHSFVFLIRDRATGSLLFLGRLVEPKG
jgi:serpin B